MGRPRHSNMGSATTFPLTAEEQFERELGVFRTEAQTAAQFFYGFLAIHAAARAQKPIAPENRSNVRQNRACSLVLRERIELSTSPLPRECSTTELPQRAGRLGCAKLRPRQAPRSCHRGGASASAHRCPAACAPVGLARKPGGSEHWRLEVQFNPMTQRDKSEAPQRSGRTDRLRAALRENLKRRKVQAKGRAREPGPESAENPGREPSAPPPAGPGPGKAAG